MLAKAASELGQGAQRSKLLSKAEGQQPGPGTAVKVSARDNMLTARKVSLMPGRIK